VTPPDSVPEKRGFPDDPLQQVRVQAGFGYGVIGADLHVFGDGRPLYLLHQYRPDPEPDTAWLLAQPSRMLNARYAVVGFTGRDHELADLAAWRDASRPRLSARWLHAPGGQGKTRLASAFARQSASANWKVITAAHGPGSMWPLQGSNDLRPGAAAGVLLIIDYADRWPASHLAWLFSNALLHGHVPARVLLVARTAHAWPAVRAELDTHQAGTSDQLLAPLPDEPGGRQRMFTVARDAFARHYGITDPVAIQSPALLSDPDFGLTLAVHMAALVAVDAAGSGDRLPEDMAGLTAYLLDRERQHWTKLYENQREGLEFSTPPSVMARAVFTAVLTGAAGYQEGSAIVTRLDLGVHAPRILADHGVCYPPADHAADTVLEPLFPDRLAEDFLAVSMPGHDISGHPADPWTSDVLASLLASAVPAEVPPYTPRAVTFLAAAAARWPHIATRHLDPLLRHDPAIAVRAGSAALASLAELAGMPIDLLDAIAANFPPDRDADLDSGIAAVTRRLADHNLAHTQDPLTRARIRDRLATRLTYSGLHQEALDTIQVALPDWRYLAQADSVGYEPELGRVLGHLASELRLVGRREEALARAVEAVEILQRHPQHELELARSTDLLSVCQQELGRQDEAVAMLSSRSIAIYRQLAQANPHEYEPGLARALNNLGIHWRNAGRLNEAMALFREAVEVNRRLARGNAAAHDPELAITLNSLGNLLLEMGQHDQALLIVKEAVEVNRRLAAANPDAHEHNLAMALNTLGSSLQLLAKGRDALPPTEEAVEICRRLTAANPEAHEPTLALALDNLGTRLAMAATLEGRDQAEAAALALSSTEEAVGIFRRLAASSPARFEHDLARSLNNLATWLAQVSRVDEAVTVAEEGIAIRRRLAADNPAAHQARLAWDLGSLGLIMAAQGGQLDRARTLIEESIGITRKVVTPDSPTDYQLQLARMLITLALINDGVPAAQERTQTDISEAIKILEPLADQRPEFLHALLAQARQLQNQSLEKRRHHQHKPGGKHQPNAQKRPEHGRRGADLNIEATLSFRQAALGSAVQVKPPGTTQTITAQPPASLKDGQKILLRGHGSPGSDGGLNGDLYVTVRVQPHEVFARADDNLTVTVPVSVSEAARGADIQIPVLDGQPMTIRIPMNTPNGQVLRVASHGVRRPDGTRGDLLVSAELTSDDADAAATRADLIAKAASA
jgi:tetratricopeptide (TPR) repeat protein